MAVVFLGLGLLRLDIDTDIVRSLPSEEKVIGDGLEIFEHHPIHDQVAVDIMIEKSAPDTLVEIGAFLEERMENSGLFSQIGTESIGALIPDLALYASKNLPLLFTEEELENRVAPLLESNLINTRILGLYQNLSNLDGIGQTSFIGRDPLGLKDVVLARLAPLAPSLNATFYRGSLLSADGQHLLVTARPKAGGTDTVSARSISKLISEISQELSRKYAPSGQKVTLTPVGAYRAALDNETIIRHDVQLALLLVTVGICLLLLFSFPRPLMGLLSLLPALAGTSAALFVYSLFHSSISIMVLGFGGAVISITVDHGIAYLLFLDRPHETKGVEASHEVRAISIMAVITSIGAFLILSCSGFPIFTELGHFTALGILFSYLFVHTVLPRIFPTMPAGSSRALPIRGLVNGLYNLGKPGAVVALLLAVGLLFFAKPQFHVSLSSMNTMSEETLDADSRFIKVWGSVDQRILLMNLAGSIADIQSQNDTLLREIEHDVKERKLASAFVPSMIFPGKERGEENLRAWQKFWDVKRVKQLTIALQRAGEVHGFTSDAFKEFFSFFDRSDTLQPQSIPPHYYRLLGISENTKDTGLIQFITVLPGEKYKGEDFLKRYGQEVKVFDATYFTERLADILFSTFTTILVIIAASVALLLFFFYLNIPLTLLTLLPPFFAYICTLGTLKLLSHPLDIPSLMLSIVILGMGIDYSIFCVRAHQRYRDVHHPSYILVRMTVFIAGASTLIGFGVLCVAEHSLLKSIGLTSLFGIGYSLLGTFLLLPPLLTWYFSVEREKIPSKKDSLVKRVCHRFRLLEAYPKMFSFCKLRFDPMFRDLPQLLANRKEIKTIVDIGCGYGVPACWCLEKYEAATVFGVDPDPERVRVASHATGDRGVITCGIAQDIGNLPVSADVVLLLDMLHYLDDETTASVLKKSVGILANNGLLVARYVIHPSQPSWFWHVEDKRVKLTGRSASYRSREKMCELMEEAGFKVTTNEVSTDNHELIWMVGRAEKMATDAG